MEVFPMANAKSATATVTLTAAQKKALAAFAEMGFVVTPPAVKSTPAKPAKPAKVRASKTVRNMFAHIAEQAEDAKPRNKALAALLRANDFGSLVGDKAAWKSIKAYVTVTVGADEWIDVPMTGTSLSAKAEKAALAAARKA